MKIWDISTRLYHWLQLALVVGLFATGWLFNGPHELMGLGLFTLVIWRIFLGMWGSETSRFKQFVRSPWQVIRYLLGDSKLHMGHNPAGGWMVVAMISVIFLQCITGAIAAGFVDSILVAYLDAESIIQRVETLHSVLAPLLLLLIALHLLAIVVYKFNSKPLVWAMVTGRQKQFTNEQSLYFISSRRALMMFVAAGLVTMTLIVLK